MIKVLEEKPVPRKTIICGNCGSVLEYGNADLHKDYDPDYEPNYTGLYRPMCFTCPVCGVKVIAGWIGKRK